MGKNINVYLASPFFNEEQVNRVNKVKATLTELGYRVYSPKDELVCKANPTPEEAKHVFEQNCINIIKADVVVAITDGKDIGTIWEAGFAYGNFIPVVYYCETLGNNPFNLMLAQSGKGVITSFDNISDVIQDSKIWEGEIE